MDKNFSLYLIKLGFFDEKASKDIIKPNNQIEKKTFIDSSFHYLMNFFDNLNESQKKYMSFFIPTNYQQIIIKIRKRKLKSIFIQKILRQKLILLKNLYIWKRNNNLNTNSLSNNNNIHEPIYDQNNNIKLTKSQNLQVNQDSVTLNDYLSKEKINKRNVITNIKNILKQSNLKENQSKNGTIHNKIINKYNRKYPYSYYNNRYPIYLCNQTIKQKKPNYEYIYNNLYRSSMSKNYNRNKNKLLTSLEEKELENLKECTFKPRINKSVSKKLNKSEIKDKNKENKEENVISIFERLYKDEQKNKLSKELKTVDKEFNLGKTFSFAPKLNNKFKKFYKYQDHKNFVQRQREYMEKSDKKKEELRDEVDSKFDLLCPFNPKITNEKGEYYKSKNNKTSEKNAQSYSVFKRLYLDMMSRKEMQEQKELENINKINEMANYLTADKKVNESDIIERLLDYNKDEIINKAKEKVEREEGVTFQPDIMDNEYIQNVNGNFLERNEQWLLNRKNYIEQESAKQIENIRNSGEFNNSNKKYTIEEREQIINNVIERLYERKKKKKNKEEKKDDESSLKDINNNENEENEDNEEEQGEED